MKHMLEIKVMEKMKKNTHFMLNDFFFNEIVPFMRYVEKYGTARQFTDDNTAHSHFMLDTEFYKRALLICNKR